LSYVSISKPVKDRIVQAARETPTEIIGFLLGRLQDDTIIIEDSTTHEFSSEPHRVMLPPTSIAVIADKLVSGRLKGKIVGWYHSHTEGGLFYSETDIATQKRLQQFSTLITGLVVDSSTGEVGFFRVIPGTNQAVRLRESNITVFTDPNQAVPEKREAPIPTAPTPTVEIRRRVPTTTALSRRVALAVIVIVLIVSIGAFASVLNRYGASTYEPVTIQHMPVTASTVGNPIEVLANVTGPGSNVTLVYGQTNGGPMTQVLMNPIAKGQYGYSIPANEVVGNIAYYIKAYDPTGRQVNTTVYHIAIADFSLQPQANSLTVYRTRMSTLELQLLTINNFKQQVDLSTNGNPGGLTLSFSANPAASGTSVGMNVSASATVPNGTYPVTLIATYSPPQSPEISRETVVDITVADFQVAVTPSSDTVQAGSTAAFTIAVTLQKGFVDAVSIINVTGLPHGATYTVTAINPTALAGGPGTTDVTLQVKIVAFTKMGTYPIVIVISGGGVTHSLIAQIIVR
jgi:proteasome lid subunit RPN8/RPN11